MLDAFGVAHVRALRVRATKAQAEKLHAMVRGDVQRHVVKNFPTSFIGWYVAVNDQRPRKPRAHHRRDTGPLALLGCAGRLRGNATVWGGGVGAVVAGAAAHPSGSVAAAFDGALGGSSVAWLRRRRVLRQQIALHALLVGAATRLRLRREPQRALGLEVGSLSGD